MKRIVVALSIAVAALALVALTLSIASAAPSAPAQRVTFTKGASNPTPHVGDVFTYTLRFNTTSVETQTIRVRVTDPNPKPSYLEIFTRTITLTPVTGTAIYSPTLGIGGGVVWTGTLQAGGTQTQVVAFQVRVTGMPSTAFSTGYSVTNRVTMVDQIAPGSLPLTTTQAIVRIMPARLFLPLVLRNYAPFANGDFEAQLVGWSTGGIMRVETVTGLYSGAPPPSITGAYAARLGGDDSVYPEGQVPVGYGALCQTFSVPDITDPEITIRYRVATRDVVYGTKTQDYFDDFEVAIDQQPWEITDSARDAAGCKQSSPVPSAIDMNNEGLAFCDGNRTGNPTGTAALHDTGWHTVTLRLGPSLRKKNVTLYMANFNRVDQYWNTWTYVDEVSVNW